MAIRAPMFRRSALLTLALLPWLAQGQVRSKAVTATRQVKIFLDLEMQLMEAQRSGDAAAVDKLITADFEQRNSAQPGNPTPRAEWRSSMREQWPGEIWLEQIAVHDRGDTALVSFLVRPQRRRERRQVRLDLRHRVHHAQRRHGQHEARRARLPDPAELGQRGSEARPRPGLLRPEVLS